MEEESSENNTRYNDKHFLDWVQSLIVGINDDEMNMDNHTDMAATEDITTHITVVR